ncbi:Oligopeptidase A [Polystyrenella longa]|uniref:oligopeptidase A n=1 Tax=Polystyrenella longa TaxID=2528007 RepID=A0A518CJK5_9PLAN|nr:M3 family metallopeptidase [Polystyrenella longa]QDU79387.1 Oligopeptidase A [Polystyrenella longa]
MTTMSENPLLQKSGLPQFDKIEPGHVAPAVKQLLEDSGKAFIELDKNVQPTWSGLVEPLEKIGRRFEQTWGPVGHLLGVNNSTELRAAYEGVLGDVVSFGLKMKQSKPLYEAFKELREGNSWSDLDSAQQRIVSQSLLEAELAGVGLEGEQKERFNEIAQELSQLSTTFSNNVLDATKEYELIVTNVADTKGWPDSLKQLTAQSYNEAKPEDKPEADSEKGPWRVTLDIPCFGPFLEHCQNRDLREEVYRARVHLASNGELDNTENISRILKLREEKSKLLGYQNYAELSLAQKMAPSVAAVEEMFEELRTAAWTAAEEDMKDIQTLASELGQNEPVMNWDAAFWSERLREKRFSFTDEELRPYFSLERVLDGLFGLVERIFGITVKAADGDAPVWNKDVRYFKIFNEAGYQCAAFFLDPYSRPKNKRGGAWMDDCLSRRIVDGEVQLPVAYLICNSTPPIGDKPSLMTFREVETLFHEFGHGLQHMMTTINYADASGINGVEWDAVELPSQFMENWCYHRPTLLGMTAHYETGEPLPEELFEKICAARTFRSGTMMLRQVLFGMTDMTLHSTYDPNGDQTIFDLHQEISKKTSVLPLLPDDKSLCAFQHIFAGGYAAGYYSYKWAEVLSADAFGAFEEVGLNDDEAVAAVGRHFRDTVLSLGGSRHPMDLFKEFRGREPSTEALLRHSGLKN